VPDFATLQNQLDARELKGMFRTGWQMDYPSIENFLAPLYGKGADSNYSEYNNPEFDKKLAEAAAAPTTEQANGLYQEAEAILAKDFPVMPLWYSTTQVGWSDKVTDVKVTPFGTLDLSAIKKK
jgi:oligopeptide transport system substrate-binding protein